MEFRAGNYWSHTLGQDLETCDRRVFYRVWGGHGGWNPEGTPLSRLLYTAKNTQTLQTYVGSLVHEACRRVIERLRAGLVIAPLRTWLDRFDERMREEIQYSAKGSWKKLRNPKKATLVMYQHLVGADLHDWEVDEAIERARKAFSNFYTMYLPILRELERDRILLIDSLDKMKFDDFDLFLSPDLVLLEGYETEVIDWKTGVGTNADQLKAYGWYLVDYAKRKGLTLLPVVGRSIPLLDPTKELRIPIGEEEFSAVEVRIRRDLGKLRAMGEKAEDGDLAFSKTAETSNCDYCFFEFHCRMRPNRAG